MLPSIQTTGLLHTIILLLTSTYTHGGCEFPLQWQGRWFQSGFGILQVNRTTVETKGECIDSLGDKFVVYDKADDCYRCMVIHQKHPAVLQYKETFCDQKATLQELCYAITGDAPLYSMFRKYPPALPVPCPFKAAPFTFSYNRGSGECSNPPSRAESCTDDSRLVLKYQACPDIQSTESNVEEMVCVATWKEGSTRYLVGRITQPSRRSVSDEDAYRCFIYEHLPSSTSPRTTYHVAQSGDATCNGLQSAVEGSRTMRLTTADSHHGKCRFPSWITDHHTWLSLDHGKIYKFSVRNATLRITKNTQPGTHHSTEIRLVCHSILSNSPTRLQLVAHITRGCDSGYVCLVFHRRDTAVIELQQPEMLHESPEDACRETGYEGHETLITTGLKAKMCPHAGRYEVIGVGADHAESRRRKRQDSLEGGPTGVGSPADDLSGAAPEHECLWNDYEALNIGCGPAGNELMEFRASCQHQPISAYTCHGSWEENNTHYLIASPVSRKSTDALRYCLVYTFDGEGQTAEAQQQNTGQSSGVSSGAVGYTPPARTIMRLSALGDSCHRGIVPGKNGLWRFNFTTNGGCSRGSETGSSSVPRAGAASLLLAGALLVLR